MIGLNRPKGINIKNNIELDYLRQSGKMLKSVKKIIKNNIQEGITTKELDYIAEKEILNLGDTSAGQKLSNSINKIRSIHDEHNINY